MSRSVKSSFARVNLSEGRRLLGKSPVARQTTLMMAHIANVSLITTAVGMHGVEIKKTAEGSYDVVTLPNGVQIKVRSLDTNHVALRVFHAGKPYAWNAENKNDPSRGELKWADANSARMEVFAWVGDLLKLGVPEPSI